jgi:transcriptional regulator with XRE-family HTH domain
MTQVELGDRAEIHPTWISQVEAGRVNPTFGNVLRISRGLKVPLPELARQAQELEK